MAADRQYFTSFAGNSRAAGADETLFVPWSRVCAWAAEQDLDMRRALVRLLTAGVWPERLRRDFGLRTGPQLCRLLNSRVLVVGCGGLGGAAAEHLTRSGVGALRLVDKDCFAESNLNRQRFCTEATLGQPKAQVVAQALSQIASYMDIDVRVLDAGPDTLPALLADVDAVLDCVDSIPLKIQLEAAAGRAGVPFVHGAVLREEGFAFGHCGPRPRLPDLYPQGKPNPSAERAAQAVGGLAPSGVAILMTALCLKMLLGSGKNGTPACVDSPLYHWDASLPALESFAWKEE